MVRSRDYGRVISRLHLHWSQPSAQSVTQHIRNHLLDMAVAQQHKFRCPCCGELGLTVGVRRRNTAYAEKSLNWLFSCDRCFREDFEHFEDLWCEYLNAVM